MASIDCTTDFNCKVLQSVYNFFPFVIYALRCWLKYRLHHKLKIVIMIPLTMNNNQCLDNNRYNNRKKRSGGHHDPCSLFDGEATLPSPEK